MRSNEPLHSDGLGHQSLGAIAVQGGVQSEESGSPAPSSRPGSRANSESSEGSGMTTPAELILSAIAAATPTKTKGILGARKIRPVSHHPEQLWVRDCGDYCGVEAPYGRGRGDPGRANGGFCSQTEFELAGGLESGEEIQEVPTHGGRPRPNHRHGRLIPGGLERAGQRKHC